MRFSIIIPTYNNAQFLARAIESALNQTHQNFEILIVDDASTDNTEQIVQSFVADDDRIRYFKLSSNSGGAAAPKNHALKFAQGELIAVLDSDDEWLPEKLERQLKLFKEHPTVSFIGCHELIVDEQGIERLYQIPEVPNVMHRILQSDYLGGGSCTAYRRDVFNRYGGFDEELNSGQDWEMRIRLAQNSGYKTTQGDPLVKRYLHENNISKTAIEKKQKDLDHIEEKYQRLYEKHSDIYSNKLRSDGTRLILAGHGRAARRAFLRAFKQNPRNLQAVLFFFLSFLGTTAYKKLTLLKQRLTSRG